MGSIFLSAAWRKLIMANYEVPAQILNPCLPAGTELDLYQNKCYVSVIGFLFADIRLKGWRIPFHTNSMSGTSAPPASAIVESSSYRNSSPAPP